MDDGLLTGLAAGDAAAYQQAYDRYGSALFRTAVRMLRSQQDAEDAVQEVFAAMARSRERLGQVVNLRAYLFTALRHAAERIHRRQQRHAATGLEDAPLSMDCPLEDGERTEALWKLVRSLPMEQRNVLSLKIQGGLTFREIGDVCGISPNTAASRYRYALEKLKQMLEIEE